MCQRDYTSPNTVIGLKKSYGLIAYFVGVNTTSTKRVFGKPLKTRRIYCSHITGSKDKWIFIHLFVMEEMIMPSERQPRELDRFVYLLLLVIIYARYMYLNAKTKDCRVLHDYATRASKI